MMLLHCKMILFQIYFIYYKENRNAIMCPTLNKRYKPDLNVRYLGNWGRNNKKPVKVNITQIGFDI